MCAKFDDSRFSCFGDITPGIEIENGLSKFAKSRVWVKVLDRSTLIFSDTQIPFQHSVG